MLFHVATGVLPVGHVLHPYAIAREHRALISLADHAASVGPGAMRDFLAGAEWRDLLQQRDHRAEMVLLEALFERARVRVAPRLPSRLDAVFAWRTLAVARRYRAEYHPSGVIHRCSLAAGTAIERDGALVVAAFEAADLARPSARDLRLVDERAERYWLAQAPMALPETLVHGSVVIEAVIASCIDVKS
ncbi:MAG: hypothetical protein ACRDJC_07085 [Thermomicrobiales bacterium]